MNTSVWWLRPNWFGAAIPAPGGNNPGALMEMGRFQSPADHPRHVQRSIAANREHIGLVVETELIGASDSGRADRPELLSVIKVDLPSRRSVAHYNGVLSAVGHGIHRAKTQTDGSGGRPDVDCPHAGLRRGWVVCATRH